MSDAAPANPVCAGIKTQPVHLVGPVPPDVGPLILVSNDGQIEHAVTNGLSSCAADSAPEYRFFAFDGEVRILVSGSGGLHPIRVVVTIRRMQPHAQPFLMNARPARPPRWCVGGLSLLPK